ncbi:putative potassium channel, voltage-dependent, ERG [Rosa chinensis]|uniref:Putative potassium channel, voltage-dependent, ERG n=1 Tax=Rosa chinensis TaxID=74649 RepID=A0A2P6SJ80_ROSCH|nr:putative potassium channel, voltage-dependent, ERG [Rosa chinensis]
MLLILLFPTVAVLDLFRMFILDLWWDTTFVISCVIAVSLDPLFFYIPTINGEEKCLEMDTKLMIVSLVLRSFTDIIFIWDIIYQMYKATAIANIWRSVATDFLAILPVPQVLIIVILYKHQDLGYLNVFLFIQYAPRIYRLSQSFDNLKQKRDTGLWVKVAFNFFLYMLACHILGGSWFFFSVQREMLCWHQTCVEKNTCGSNFKCSENSSRNVTKLVQLCPMNPPNSTVFDFGIFANPLGTSSKTPINFSTKFSYSFWWGVRNISNFGTNLVTSTYLGEVWFASLISVIGLILFVYLIGNNVQTFMQMKTMKEEEEAKKIRQKLKRINSWMERIEFPWPREEIETKIKEKLQENKEANVENVSTLLSFVPLDCYEDVKSDVCWAMLEDLPVFKDHMGRRLLFYISARMKKEVYAENTLIAEKYKPLDRMVVITEGIVGVHTTSTDSSPSIIQGSLEKWHVYGVEQLLSWAAHSTNGNIDSLPISQETVKCRTKVEGFVLTASDLKELLSGMGIDHAAISNNIEGESSSSLRSALRFRRHLQRVRPVLDFDPSSYRGL